MAEAMGNLFDTYSPEGALGGMFAPAYIKGFAPSEQAVADYQAANHGLTDADVEATRMPQPITPVGMGNITTGKGSVDPAALRALAQGGHYDMGARRNAIAQQLASNSALQGAHSKVPSLLGLGGGYNPFFVDPAAGG